MQQLSTFADAFRWTSAPPRRRHIVPFALALAVALVAAVAIDLSAPLTPVANAADAAPTAPLPYVSSDPSVPPADSVKFPDATPHVEAF